MINRDIIYAQTNGGKIVVRRTLEKTRDKHFTKNLARIEMAKALMRGDIDKSTTCVKCGAGGRIEGHHPDYGKPLAVLWVCTSCHATIHSNK